VLLSAADAIMSYLAGGRSRRMSGCAEGQTHSPEGSTSAGPTYPRASNTNLIRLRILTAISYNTPP
jgi:hypothetical protein